MTIGEDIRRWLLGLPEVTGIVGDRIHQNKVPQDTTAAYIFYVQASADSDTGSTLGESDQLMDETYDIEVISTDLGEALQVKSAIQTRHKHRGPFGTGRVQCLLMEQVADDYVPKGVQSDQGWNVAPLDMRILGYTEI